MKKNRSGVVSERVLAIRTSNIEVRLDADSKKAGKPIYTKLIIGGVPCFALKRPSRLRGRVPQSYE